MGLAQEGVMGGDKEMAIERQAHPRGPADARKRPATPGRCITRRATSKTGRSTEER